MKLINNSKILKDADVLRILEADGKSYDICGQYDWRCADAIIVDDEIDYDYDYDDNLVKTPYTNARICFDCIGDGRAVDFNHVLQYYFNRTA